MIFKTLEHGAIAVTGAVMVGGLVPGKDLTSYLHSSSRSVQDSIKDAVPVKFELQRGNQRTSVVCSFLAPRSSFSPLAPHPSCRSTFFGAVHPI